MPTSKEFAIRMQDQPGTLGKVCRALAERGVNILAFQSFATGGESLVRFVVDNPKTAKTVLDNQRLSYAEAEVAQVKLPRRPGSWRERLRDSAMPTSTTPIVGLSQARRYLS